MIYLRYYIFFTLFSEVSSKEEQFSNCVQYLSVWAIWTPQKMLFLVAIQGVRWPWQELWLVSNNTSCVSSLGLCMSSMHLVWSKKELDSFTGLPLHLSGKVSKWMKTDSGPYCIFNITSWFHFQYLRHKQNYFMVFHGILQWHLFCHYCYWKALYDAKSFIRYREVCFDYYYSN